MVRREIVQRKLAELDARVARVRTHRRTTADELASDRDALDLVAFNLMLAVQAVALTRRSKQRPTVYGSRGYAPPRSRAQVLRSPALVTQALCDDRAAFARVLLRKKLDDIEPIHRPGR